MSARLRASCLAMSVLGALLASPAKLAAIDFAAARSYPVGTSPAAIAIGDFNGDGKVDIAVANTGSGDVSVLLGNGDGTFQTAVSYSAGNSPGEIAVGDFNGDGKLDLAVLQLGTQEVSGSVSILLGKGDGTFQAPKTLVVTLGRSMAVADFNLDQKSDLAVCDGALLDIFLGNADGTFQAAKNAALSLGCGGLVTADFNGDSKYDLAFITTAGIQILLGQGDGTFAQGSLVAVSGVVAPVVPADFNHDGKLDLAVNTLNHEYCGAGPCNVSALLMFPGNGDGSFQTGTILASATTSPRGNPFYHPVAGDFNGDGKLDLAYFNSAIQVLLGKGDGAFSPPVLDLPLLGATPKTIAQDLSGRNLADLVAVGTANDIEVWLNISPTSGADLGVLSPAVTAAPYVVGSSLTFAADVANEGPQDATGITFTDTLPNGVNFVSATATQGSCTQANGIVSCSIGDLASAFDSWVNVVVTPTTLGTITNAMNVTGNEPDMVPGNNSATQTINVVAQVTLTVTDAGKGSGTVISNPGAINCGSACSANYAQGSSVSLFANPVAGSVFAGWTGACTGTDPKACSVTMNSAQSVTATFNLAPDFAVSLASTTFTMQTGAQVTDAVTLTEQNGFAGQVNLSCAVNGPAPLATCQVSPASLTLGADPSNSTLTITAPTSLTAFAVPGYRAGISTAYAAVLALPAFLLFGIGLAPRRFRSRGIVFCFLLGGLIVLFAALAGCGGGSTPPPSPKNYVVTVSAASISGSLQHSVTVATTVE